jgi:GUN4-like/DnaJ C terminal domain
LKISEFEELIPMSSDEQSINDSQLSDFLAKHSLPPDFLSRHTKALRYEMEISLREAMFGGLRQISINRMEICTVCQGQGNLKQRLWSRSRSTCPTCGGSGTVEETKQIQVTIPPEMFQMMSSLALIETTFGEGNPSEPEFNRLASVCFTVAGEGHAEAGNGSRGDLNVHLSLAEDPNFSRLDTDLFSHLEISQSQADSGYVIVDTLDGLTRCKIPLASERDDAQSEDLLPIEAGVEGAFIMGEAREKAIFLALEGRGLFTSMSSNLRGKHLLVLIVTEAPKPPPRFADEDALDSAVGVNYRPLRDWLRTKNWREADTETHKVMLQACKRESEGWLDEASLKQFSCQDLQTIDRLWSKYSDGQFGFAAQNSVWQQCYRRWDNFEERVGWLGLGEIDVFVSMNTVKTDYGTRTEPKYKKGMGRVMVPYEKRTFSHLGELPSWRFLDKPEEEHLVSELLNSFREPDHRYRFRFLDRIQNCKL